MSRARVLQPGDYTLVGAKPAQPAAPSRKPVDRAAALVELHHSAPLREAVLWWSMVRRAKEPVSRANLRRSFERCFLSLSGAQRLRLTDLIEMVQA